MIRVEAVEPSSDEWRRWRAAADAATRKMIDDGKAAMDRDLYKGGRSEIYRLFFGKCAYCESPLERYGDVDHFRPKDRVTDHDGKIVFLDATTRHPGYYWLAYDWKNLLPSCTGCNRPGANPDGTSSGKWDYFPVEGKRACKPTDPIEDEKPWLLDPYRDNPDDHLVFDDVTGVIGFRTPRGKYTIDRLGLNRNNLVEMRKGAARAAGDHYAAFINATMTDDSERARSRKDEWEKHERGEVPWSAFGRRAIAMIRDRIVAAMRR